MPAIEPFCHFIGINSYKLTKEEMLLLEADLLAHICEELKEVFRTQHKDYFRLMKLNKEKEDAMLEAKLARLIIQDILSTKEYTLIGIASYTDSHEDVVQEILDGRNINPSATLLRKIIALH
ncbi:MAG: hypothetical protein ACD_46C00083G0001, partial [uncultured bacterium]